MSRPPNQNPGLLSHPLDQVPPLRREVDRLRRRQIQLRRELIDVQRQLAESEERLVAACARAAHFPVRDPARGLICSVCLVEIRYDRRNDPPRTPERREPPASA